jgi:hypothetical protein
MGETDMMKMHPSARVCSNVRMVLCSGKNELLSGRKLAAIYRTHYTGEYGW